MVNTSTRGMNVLACTDTRPQLANIYSLHYIQTGAGICVGLGSVCSKCVCDVSENTCSGKHDVTDYIPT